MASGSVRFAEFELDPAERLLRRGGQPVEVNGRYFDALELLVREHGRLVSKTRFMDEVWRGVPVTDEALTQCVRMLRKQLGDDAARPRFIETVPRHGYRFIAAIEAPSTGARRFQAQVADSWRGHAMIAVAGTAGGAAAGLGGGLAYGFAIPADGIGSASTVAVLLSITMFVGLIGGAGVSGGIAVAALVAGRAGAWSIIGGAAGGLVVGAIAKLLAVDAFALLVGRSPGDVTGAAEGLALGAAAGLAAWLSLWRGRRQSVRVAALCGAASGGIAGLAIAALGGSLMAGSLLRVAGNFNSSRLRFDQLGALLGDSGFGQSSQLVTAALEGALFTSFVVAAMALASTIQERRGGTA